MRRPVGLEQVSEAAGGKEVGEVVAWPPVPLGDLSHLSEPWRMLSKEGQDPIHVLSPSGCVCEVDCRDQEAQGGGACDCASQRGRWLDPGGAVDRVRSALTLESF